MNALTNVTATMTSLELVDFINDHRKMLASIVMAEFPSKGFAKLEHRDFTAKVPEVLGDGVCESFRTPHVNSQNGQTYQIYNFPKREACLMALSYSYELQAKVFDKMTALEGLLRDLAIPQTIPQTMSAALRLAADQADQIEVQQAQLAIASPKAEALDRIATAEDGRNNHERLTYISYFWLPRPPIQ